MNILLVDDEVLVTRGLAMQLNRLKPQWHIVGMASNGETAMELIQQADVDIMVTDIRMPRMDGLELSRQALELKPLLKIIVLTGFAEFEYARTALRYGVQDFLLKPVEYTALTELLERIETSISGSCGPNCPIERSIQFIEKNYFSPTLSLIEVADFVQLTPQYFSRFFKQKTGELFIHFLTQIRIREAKRLLEKNTSIKMYEIGEAVGYFDQHYFSQIFRKVVGVTPKQYRELKNQTD